MTIVEFAIALLIFAKRMFWIQRGTDMRLERARATERR
jgi:hypothetical protein